MGKPQQPSKIGVKLADTISAIFEAGPQKIVAQDEKKTGRANNQYSDHLASKQSLTRGLPRPFCCGEGVSRGLSRPFCCGEGGGGCQGHIKTILLRGGGCILLQIFRFTDQMNSVDKSG